MKRKHFIALLCAPLLLTACKKSQQPENPIEVQKYEVTFSVSNFDQTVGKFGVQTKATQADGAPVRSYSNILKYRIFDASGTLVNSIDQNSSSTTFGTIADKLQPGSYTAVIAASKENFNIPGQAPSYNGSIIVPQTNYWTDTYMKQIPITVGTDAVNTSVRLDRVVGGLEVVLTDAIPTNVSKILVKYQSDGNALFMNGNDTDQGVGPKTTEFPLALLDKGVKNKAFLSYIGNTSTTSAVLITALDALNNVVVEKTVTGVRCYKNQKTTLTGALFPVVPTNAGFTVTVDPAWSATGTTVNF